MSLVKFCCSGCGRDCTVDKKAYDLNPKKAHYCKACHGWPWGQPPSTEAYDRPQQGITLGYSDMNPNGVPDDEL